MKNEYIIMPFFHTSLNISANMKVLACSFYGALKERAE